MYLLCFNTPHLSQPGQAMCPWRGMFIVQDNLPPPPVMLQCPQHQCSTAFEALTTHVPFNGLCADIVAVALGRYPTGGLG